MLTMNILAIYKICMAKVIISLPSELLHKVDRYCEENEYNRSEFIRFAMRGIISEDREDRAKHENT